MYDLNRYEEVSREIVDRSELEKGKLLLPPWKVTIAGLVFWFQLYVPLYLFLLYVLPTVHYIALGSSLLLTVFGGIAVIFMAYGFFQRNYAQAVQTKSVLVILKEAQDDV